MSGVSKLLMLSLVLLAAGTVELPAQEGPAVKRGFVLQSSAGPATQVIQSPEALAAFVACLPERLPHMKEPAPLNPDPLRAGTLQLDFSREVLVVCVHRDTISAFPDYRGVCTETDARVVAFEVPDRPPEARPNGWGVYTAVVLPRCDLPTRIQEIAVKGSW